MHAIIDFATAADLPEMIDLMRELFTLESDFQPEHDKQLQGLQRILDTPILGRLFVIRRHGRAIGMANALTTISTAQGTPVVLLEDVIVSPAYRGQGLGRKLVAHVCTWAKSQGMTRVTLLADRDNTAALSFYEALGFQKSAMVVRRKLL